MVYTFEKNMLELHSQYFRKVVTREKPLPYITRLMVKEDLDQVNEIDHEAFPTQWPPANYRQELQNKIPGILSFEHGANISQEGKDLGFTYVYELSFANIQALDAYLPHPAHYQFGEFLGRLDIVEDVFVVDYVPQSE